MTNTFTRVIAAAAIALTSVPALAANPDVGGAAMFETKTIGNCPACLGALFAEFEYSAEAQLFNQLT